MTDRFDWQPFKGGTGAFVKFEAVGDEIVGKIVGIRTHTFDVDKGAVPLLDMEPKDGGDLVTLSIDKVDLRYKLAELNPQIGDQLAVRYTGNERVANGVKKVFAVRHKPSGLALDDPPADRAPAEDYSDYGEEPF